MQDLFLAAREAMRKAYAPYSSFPVGVALLADNGQVFSGCNIENASFPEGWCAETTALGHMVMAGARRFTEVAVVAERMDKIMPCGGCRQRLSEFAAEDALLHLCDSKGIVETIPFTAAFPKAFGFKNNQAD